MPNWIYTLVALIVLVKVIIVLGKKEVQRDNKKLLFNRNNDYFKELSNYQNIENNLNYVTHEDSIDQMCYLMSAYRASCKKIYRENGGEGNGKLKEFEEL